MWRAIDAIPNWWMSLDRLPNTNYLRHLTENERVVFITNRKDGAGYPIEDQTAQWLIEKFHIWQPNVIISDNKGPVAAGLKLDYFIDDRPKNVEEVIAGSPDTETYLLDTTYNQECPIQRVFTFDEFAMRCLPVEVQKRMIPSPVSSGYERCVI